MSGYSHVFLLFLGPDASPTFSSSFLFFKLLFPLHPFSATVLAYFHVGPGGRSILLSLTCVAVTRSSTACLESVYLLTK